MVVTLMVMSTIGIGFASTSGQLLSEKTYFNEDFEDKSVDSTLPEESSESEYIGHLESNAEAWEKVVGPRNNVNTGGSMEKPVYDYYVNANENCPSDSCNDFGNEISNDGDLIYQGESGYLGYYHQNNGHVAFTRTVDTSGLSLGANNSEPVYVAVDMSTQSYDNDPNNMLAVGDHYMSNRKTNINTTAGTPYVWNNNTLGSGAGNGYGSLLMGNFLASDGLYASSSDFSTGTSFKVTTGVATQPERVKSPWEKAYGEDAKYNLNYSRLGTRVDYTGSGSQFHIFKIEDPEEVPPLGSDEISIWVEKGTDHHNNMLALRGVHVFTQDFSDSAGASVGDLPWDSGLAGSVSENDIYAQMDPVGQTIEDAIDAEQLAKSGSAGGFERTPTAYKADGVSNPDNLDMSKNAVWGYSSTEESKALEMRQGAIKQSFSISELTDTRRNFISVTASSIYADRGSSVNWELRQYGSPIASGSISAGATSTTTAEFDPESANTELIIWSKDPYTVHDVTISGLTETSQGDPLAFQNKPIDFEETPTYQNVIDSLINVLNLTTDTLLYILMIALLVGVILFSYSKSVRQQEFGESLLWGAMVSGLVILALTPTFNTITWIFTGDVQRAPLADPQLEAEPPTYYSTEFQDGTQNGWKQNNPSDYTAPGKILPEQAGDTFNLRMTGSPGNAIAARHHEHISLGNSLDTGFVGIQAAVESSPGQTPNPHQTKMELRVYQTGDGEKPDWAPPSRYYSQGSNSIDHDRMLDDYGYYDSDGNDQSDGSCGRSNECDLVYSTTLGSSFDGTTAQIDTLEQFELAEEHVYTEVVIHTNKGDTAPAGSIQGVRVGATTENRGHT
jgi:hypothetical protein